MAIARVKICGITRLEDARAAATSGADALGLNFVGGPRELTLNRAEELLRSFPPMVTPVALVRLERGQLPDDLIELLGRFWVSHVQVYGEVTPAAMSQLVQSGFWAMPVLAVKNATFYEAVDPVLSGPAKPAAIVLDAFDPSVEGGTGKTFQWQWLIAAREAGKLDGWPPIVLAGGLKPENVAEAVEAVRPYAVDVSSGVEVPGQPGHKDPERMRAFVEQAKAVGRG